MPSGAEFALERRVSAVLAADLREPRGTPLWIDALTRLSEDCRALIVPPAFVLHGALDALLSSAAQRDEH